MMWVARKIMNFFAISEEEGAETQVYLASSPEIEGVSGKYFEKCREKHSSSVSYNESDQRRLWEISAEMVGLQEHIPA
ncbi:MAG TPA: hypothetical protein VJZ27_20730, partial [Aggregatilineales bacterium]|nr:hypothetical protein [Aggregatilineales bacterium]